MSTRIEIQDTGMDVIMKLVEGNPGAIRVCMQIVKEGAKIDPDAFGGGIMHLLSFDTLNIYGSRIWMLYKDVCKQNIVSTIGVLRAWQLGFTTKEQLNQAIDNYGDGLNVADLVDKVRERLPNFGQQEDD